MCGAIILKKNFLDSLTENKDILKALAFVLLLGESGKFNKVIQKQKVDACAICVGYTFSVLQAIPEVPNSRRVCNSRFFMSV